MVKKKIKLAHNANKKGTEKTNPFELKINRKKYDIIGQRKSQSGFISKNKTKINQKRKDFFKKVNLHKNKANDFVDRRIGEYDSEMLNEDRVMARLAANQRKQHKKSLYNLGDDFDITHGGQPISSLETFDDFEGDTDDEEVQLNAEFVSDAHFGGFLTKKDNNTPKTRKEILNQFIAEHKQKKQERKDEKEQTDDLTSKLDEEWKQIHTLLPNIKASDSTKKTPCDLFDKVVNELKFEPRGNAVASSKNVEIENEKKKKKFEEERISRMNNSNKEKQCKMLSADALEENFFLFDDISEIVENEQTDDVKDNEMLNTEDADDIASLENNVDFENDSNVSNSSLEDDDSSDADDDLPSSISSLPQTCENLQIFLSNCSLEEMALKLDSALSKCRFKIGSKDLKISLKFFKCLLEFVDFKFENKETDHTLLDIVLPRLSVFVQKSPLETGKIVNKFLLNKFTHLQEQKRKKNLQCFSTLIILKIFGHLYSTSDFRHPVITLAMTFLNNLLTLCLRTTTKNIILRIFTCHIIYEYISSSKRYIPEVINYLFSVLVLASAKENSILNLVKKLNLHTPSEKILYVSSNVTENWEPIEFSDILFKHKKRDIDALSVIYYVLVLLGKFAELYKDIPIFSELFHSSITLSSFLPVENYPMKVMDKVKEVENLITKKIQKRRLVFPNKKPKMLKQFTPRFDDYCGKKLSETSQKLKAHKELSKKIKKEEKGVIREIRRDAEFEARERLKQRMENDSERKRKVKELYAELAAQERDCKIVSKRK